jgi:hypothetical protein
MASRNQILGTFALTLLACAGLVIATSVSAASAPGATIAAQQDPAAPFAAPAAWASETAESGGCLHFGLSERTVRTMTNAAKLPDDWDAGTMATYFDDVYDDAGNRVGTTVGTMSIISKDPVDGHLNEYLSEQIMLPDGAITARGGFSRKAALDQQWLGYPAVGTGGRYTGMTGTRAFRIADMSDPTFPISVRMVLCGRPS